MAQKQKTSKSLKALANELTSLIPQLDEEGLTFLIEQARVHIYNMRVIEMEAAAAAADKASTRSKKTSTRSLSAAKSSDLRIVAEKDSTTYNLVYNGQWKMFNDEEILALVRIAHSKDPAEQVAGRLYRWILAERSDVIKDFGLNGLADPTVKKLLALLKKTFTIKKD